MKNTATLKDISTFYKELGKALVIVEDKYISEPPHKRQGIQQLVGTRDAIVNTLKKIHVRICCRLRSSPTLSTPWHGDFTMDIPKQKFSVIVGEIINHNGYGHKS